MCIPPEKNIEWNLYVELKYPSKCTRLHPTSPAFVIIQQLSYLLSSTYFNIYFRACHCGNIMVTLRMELTYCIKTLRNKSEFM